jgi:hypothetical protein
LALAEEEAPEVVVLGVVPPELVAVPAVVELPVVAVPVVPVPVAPAVVVAGPLVGVALADAAAVGALVSTVAFAEPLAAGAAVAAGFFASCASSNDVEEKQAANAATDQALLKRIMTLSTGGDWDRGAQSYLRHVKNCCLGGRNLLRTAASSPQARRSPSMKVSARTGLPKTGQSTH